MRHRRFAWLAIALGLGLAVVASRVSPTIAPPLYDGVPVSEPYIWLDPPPGHPGNPSSASATLPVAGGRSPLVTIATGELDPQAQFFAVPAGLALPPGTTSIQASIKAVEPVAQPSSGRIDGNVYRILVLNQAGQPATALAAAKVSVILRAPDPTTTGDTIEVYGPATGWTPLDTQATGLGASFLAVVTQLGDFALVGPGTASSAGPSGEATAGVPAGTGSAVPSTPTPSAAAAQPGGSGIPIVTILAGLGIGVVLLGLLAIALVPRRAGSGPKGNRGWSDKPPRTRR